MNESIMKYYATPEAKVIEIRLHDIILAASDWNNGSLDDGFNELYDL